MKVYRYWLGRLEVREAVRLSDHFVFWPDGSRLQRFSPLVESTWYKSPEALRDAVSLAMARTLKARTDLRRVLGELDAIVGTGPVRQPEAHDLMSLIRFMFDDMLLNDK